MKLSDFDYLLPKELIAQYPAEERDDSRLLVAGKDNVYIDANFHQLADYLMPGDLLVFNDSKVIKACLTLEKDGKAINVNLNKQILGTNEWSAFVKPAKKLDIGDEFEFGNSKVIISNKLDDGEVIIKFDLESRLGIFDFLEIFGEMPLPPYIRDGQAEIDDEERYQTIYCKNEGSVAAPTAGLHFTDHVFIELQKKGVNYCFVTLNVGGGTFLPVKTENIEEHKMHSEYASISSENAEIINQAILEGRRIIAVGTTSLRTLEAAASNGGIKQTDFETDIFIKPGYEFKVVNGLITNFHLPKSTLIMLICAFGGYKEMMNLYQYAINNKYKFFSYGDAMLVFNKINEK